MLKPRHSRYSEKSSNRYTGSHIVSDDDYKNDINIIYNDDSKFARQLKKLLKDEEDEKKIQKLIDLSTYLDQNENIKFILKLGKPSLNILLKLSSDQCQTEIRNHLIDCIGKIGGVMIRENDSRYIDWIFERLKVNESRESKDYEIKTVLLDSLKQSLSNDYSLNSLRDSITLTLNSLKQLLESFDNSKLMMKLTQIILIISKRYFSETNYVFEDVVDILVAWHIDCTQSEEVIEYTSKALVDLKSYWLKNMNFTVTLLNQFIEDLESYMNSCFEDENRPYFDDKIEKMSALVKVYNTVLKAILINDPKIAKYHPNESEKQQILLTLKKLIECIIRIGDYKYNEFVLGISNQSIEIMYDLFGDALVQQHDLIENLIIMQNNCLQQWSNENDLSFIKLVSKTLQIFITQNNVNFFTNLMSIGKRLWSTKLSQKSDLIQETLNLHKTLISIKTIPIVLEIYKGILNDCEIAFNKICNESNVDQYFKLGENNLPIEFCVDLNINDAQSLLVFNLNILTELGNAKNHLICMYALSPTLFELLTNRLCPCVWQMADSFPNIQFAILNTLYSYCTKHESFFRNSSLIINNKSNSDTTLFMNSQTRDNFKIIIDILSQILSNKSSSLDILILISNWLNEIVDSIPLENVFLFSTEPLKRLLNSLVDAAYSDEEDVCLVLNKLLLKIIQKFIKLPDEILIRILDLSKYHMMSLIDTIQENYTKLLAYIPINILTSQHTDLSVLTKHDFSVFSRLARINYINSCINPSPFSVHHFKVIMSYLLIGQTQGDLYSKTWLERLYYSCQRNDKYKEPKSGEITFDSVIENHEGLLWFWALWEVSQFCVNSKLKTPLGKPQDLFISIENTLKSFYNNIPLEGTEVTKSEQWSFDLKRITLLVQFLEYLEKSIYNAYEGTATSIPGINNKAVKYFFKTNKQTCIEWFSRVRLYVIELSVKSGNYEIAVRQSYEYLYYALKHDSTNTFEFDQVVVNLVKSLVKLKNYQLICGLKEWLSKRVNKNFDWIQGAIEESQGRLELASEIYKKTLPINTNQVLFVNDRIIECYYELHDWKEYLNWLEEFKSIQSVKNYDTICDLNYIKALSSFDSFDMELCKTFTRKMQQFQTLNEVFDSLGSKWDIERLEDATRKEIFKSLVSKRSCVLSLDVSQAISSNLLKILGIDEMTNWNSDRVILAQLVYLAQNDSTSFDIPFVKSIKFDANKHSIKSLNEFLTFTHLKHLNRQQSENNLNLAVARLARKQLNFRLAKRLLNHQLNIYKNLNLQESLIIFSDQHSKSSNRLFVMEVENEAAKLLCTEDSKSIVPMEILAKSVSSLLDYLSLNFKTSEETNEKCARSILNLTKWISNKDNIIKELNDFLIVGATDVIDDQYNRLSVELEKILALKTHLYNDKSTFNEENRQQIQEEAFLGELLDLATLVQPKLAKSWLKLANWCYKWSKKTMEKPKSTIISDDELNSIYNKLPDDVSNHDKEFVVQTLSKFNRTSIQDEDIEQKNQNIDLKSLLLENCTTLLEKDVDNLVELWKSIVDRMYYYHKIACKSYFTYLNLNNNDNEGNVSSTLRILKILVKYSKELKDNLQDNLQKTPTKPWINIISQLFSRLNHTDQYVRQFVSQLLSRLAKDFSHLIVYPAVVGSTDGPTKIETSNEKGIFENDNENDVELQVGELDENMDEKDKEQEKLELKNAYQSLLRTLSENNLQMVNEVQLFVTEMRRITLLREELWLGTLNQLHGDASKRIEQLTNEITKINQNTSLNDEEKKSLIKEKYEIILLPITSVLEYVFEITRLPAETPNESNFHSEFTMRIEDSLKQLKNESNAQVPSNGWSQFKQLHNLLYQRSQRKNFNTLYLDQISPKLASIKSSKIPIPGADCMLYSIAATIHILPTKTKPKKLFFIGSNGKKYPFLFKGLEDLHLDERIMQLLSIINVMFDKINKTEYPHYHACNYSVTPFGPRSGLISWVENSTPLFSLYKKWQQRELAHLVNKQALTNVKPDQPIPNQIQRPSDIFNNKLNALLKEQKITITGNRNDYPSSILRQTLEELIKETPTDLLSKEIWCGAPTPGSWLNNVQVYARSTAVMSIIGYIIGLGDRHLDNLLINIHTGEIAHIDYNICFEKGKNLKIPEKIPFRLTQNLVHALGLTGVEGIFRLSCENVLNTLRNNRETLLTLLETFVYDPLLDWTSSDSGIIASYYGGGNFSNVEIILDRKKVDKIFTYRLFSIRLIENRVALQKMHERYSSFLTKINVQVKNLIELTIQIAERSNLLDFYEQAKIYFENGLKDKQHQVYTIHNRAKHYFNYCENLKAVKRIAQDYIVQYSEMTAKYREALLISKSSELQKSIESLKKKIAYESKDSPYILTVDFLKSIGQESIALQCEKFEDELIFVSKNHQEYLKSASENLNIFLKITNWLPSDFWSVAYTNKLLNWIQKMETSDYNKDIYETVIQESNKDDKLLNEPASVKHSIIKNDITTVTNRLNLLKSRKKTTSEELKFQLEFLKSNIFNHINEKYQFIPQTIDTYVCIVIQMLVNNLYKWNLMENTSIQAKEQLASLSSKDGDWFLEEMISLIGNTSHLCQLLKEIFITFGLNDRFYLFNSCSDAFIHLTNVFSDLKLILFNYQQNIFVRLINLAISKSDDLDYCVDQFQTFNFDAYFEFTSNFQENYFKNSEFIDIFNEMKLKYNQLLQNKSSNSIHFNSFNSSIYVFAVLKDKVACLLSEIDKLFIKVDIEFDKCLKFLKNCSLNYDKNESFGHLTYLLDDQYYLMCKQIFTVKKYQIISYSLTMLAQFRDSFYDPLKQMDLVEDFFIIHFKTYISEYIVQILAGIPTMLMSYLIMFLKEDQDTDLSQQAVNLSIGQKIIYFSISEQELGTVNQLITNYDSIWSSIDLNSRIESNLKNVESYKNSVEMILLVYEWIYEPYLSIDSSHRKIYIDELCNIDEKTKHFKYTIESCLERLNSSEQIILKRLEWSSGTMPTLIDSIREFESKRKIRNEYFINYKESLEKLNDTFKNLKEFELMRSNSQLSKAENVKFDEFLKKIKDGELFSYDHINDLSSIEQKLYGIKLIKDTVLINYKQIQEYLKDINDKISNLKRSKAKDERDNLEKYDELYTLNNDLKQILAQHNKVMMDIKTLLKSMNKLGNNLQLQNYTKTYQKFSSNCQILLKSLSMNHQDSSRLNDIKESTGILLELVPKIYFDLNKLSDNTNELQSNIENIDDRKKFKINKSKETEEINGYAISVWRRINQKLNGKDPDPNKTLTVEEQVDYLINEALDHDNLAVLYEGWTPWV